MKLIFPCRLLAAAFLLSFYCSQLFAQAATCPPASAADKTKFGQCIQSRESGGSPLAITAPPHHAAGLLQWMGPAANYLGICRNKSWTGCKFDGTWVTQYNQNTSHPKVVRLSCCDTKDSTGQYVSNFEKARGCTTPCNDAMLTNGAGLQFQEAMKVHYYDLMDAGEFNVRIKAGPYKGMTINQLCGQTIGGVKITRDAVHAMMNLGTGNTRKFFESGGAFDFKDAYGTSMVSYGACMSQCMEGNSFVNCVSRLHTLTASKSICDKIGDTELYE